ncbi:MAG: hypothetical protein QGG36_31320, partial [Pirellulaceae bacterium]|nr:hypothetical protein [Pirellulaceae bacterium]
MRIGASISGFERQLLNAVAEANSAAAANALRISTGKKINSPADDPSGFLRVSKMEGRLDLVQRALTRVDVASNIASGLQTNA